jgi:hypothetical protein
LKVNLTTPSSKTLVIIEANEDTTVEVPEPMYVSIRQLISKIQNHFYF